MFGEGDNNKGVYCEGDSRKSTKELLDAHVSVIQICLYLETKTMIAIQEL